MLWFLHLCSDKGIVVIDYTDEPAGTMIETESGGRFSEVTLKPQVTITDAALVDKANELHAEANRLCFIANSVNFPVRHEPLCSAE
jgi:organic hydroperoxide reductase OsmC/OhrA